MDQSLTVVAVSGHRQADGASSKDIDSWRALARSLGSAVCIWAGPPLDISETGFQVLREPREPGWRSVTWAFWAICRSKRAVRYEVEQGRVVLLNGGEQWGWLVAATVARLTCRPWVMDIHGSYLDLPASSVGALKSAVLRFATLRFARSAALCRVVNEPMRDALKSRGVNAELVPPRLQQSWEAPVVESRHGDAETKTILTVGRLTASKGYDLLLEAVAELQERSVCVRLEIVGDGPERESLKLLTKTLGVAGLVEFRGSQNTEFVREALSRCDLFVISSRDEGLPRTLLEAVASEVPVVATDVGGIPAAAAAIPSVLVVEVEAQAIAEGIQRLLANPPSTQSLKESRQAVLATYGFRNGIDALARMYQQLR